MDRTVPPCASGALGIRGFTFTRSRASDRHNIKHLQEANRRLYMGLGGDPDVRSERVTALYFGPQKTPSCPAASCFTANSPWPPRVLHRMLLPRMNGLHYTQRMWLNSCTEWSFPLEPLGEVIAQVADHTHHVADKRQHRVLW